MTPPSDSSRTLIVLNPHAGSGRAGRMWQSLEPLLWEQLGELLVAVTDKPGDVAAHLDKARAAGLTRVISIGGDGTNHALINALADLNHRYPDAPRMIYGNVPIGTGRDWARGNGIPFNDPQAAARWIATAQPTATDIGKISIGDHEEYFLNIASAGLGGEVARRVEHIRQRRPWTFLTATLGAIIQRGATPMQIEIDGVPWYEGRAYAAVVANGSTFGRGMKIAPHADVRDGLFEVVLVKGVPRVEVLAAFQRVYSGTHLTHRAVMSARARSVRLHGDAALGVELDGEFAQGGSLEFTMQPGLLSLLA
ncbi:MAG: diacylglycerol kinase family lipid kinase [Anaerolineae bacterium]|nr:diacylglycerol kinase family lipid kinase [Anaerolineae bacterium]